METSPPFARSGARAWSTLLCWLAVFALMMPGAVVGKAPVNPAFRYVTCGSAFKIKHVDSGTRLHSHAVNYGSTGGGSGQQSVTGSMSEYDDNSLWKVYGPAEETCLPGTRIACKSQLRLQHMNTKKMLHSHRGYVSPLSHNQEVSAAGDDTSTDEGDNWVLECGGSENVWVQEDAFRLKHASTGYYLHHTSQHEYGRPIAGQKEICAFPHATRYNQWTTEEGLFIKPEDLKTTDD